VFGGFRVTTEADEKIPNVVLDHRVEAFVACLFNMKSAAEYSINAWSI